MTSEDRTPQHSKMPVCIWKIGEHYGMQQWRRHVFLGASLVIAQASLLIPVFKVNPTSSLFCINSTTDCMTERVFCSPERATVVFSPKAFSTLSIKYTGHILLHTSPDLQCTLLFRFCCCGFEWPSMLLKRFHPHFTFQCLAHLHLRTTYWI